MDTSSKVQKYMLKDGYLPSVSVYCRYLNAEVTAGLSGMQQKLWLGHVRASVRKARSKRCLLVLQWELLMFALKHYCADVSVSPDLSVSAAAQMWGNTWGQWPWDSRGAAEIEESIDCECQQRERESPWIGFKMKQSCIMILCSERDLILFVWIKGFH